ncbi:uncharacterized protein LOC132555830 [Ylistrum balloti]|uniref:uncharacterized protein LOC132555830 n=1 Tax=Ylistrum balloti TaxID=509963 RepID=UPI002905E643|nr:uncharacterized protein LOC132555830 [Ylistrum balloti]
MQPVKSSTHARSARYRQSHNAYDEEDPNSPRSMNSDPDIQISHLDSVSQTDVVFNFQDVEEHHHHYIQNKAFQDTEEVRRHYIQNNANGANNSPRSAKYRSEASSKAKLAKIITVPVPEDQNHLKYHSSNPRSGQLQGDPHRGATIPKSPTHGIPQGSMRGVPKSPGIKRSVPHTQGHAITGQVSATYPGSVRGYAKINGHLTQRRRRTPSTDTKGSSVAFRRSRPERKEYYVTQFDIEFDKHERHRFLPGEELTGKIIFDISNEMDIRFIELLIIGQTTATLTQQESGVSTTKRDVFLSKRSYIIGTPDGRWTSLITPGHYVSNFRLQLPEAIPTSTTYQDKINGFNLETTYLVKARICDDVGASSARSTHSMNNFVKVLVSRKQTFQVKRPFDIHSVPMAMTPVSHVEDVPITCSVFRVREPANIHMSLDRSCFLAGDDIKIHLEMENRYANRIKKISCVLRQAVSVKGVRSKAQFNIANVEEKYPEGTITKTNKRNIIFYEIHLPTHTNFLPSVMPGCRLVTITYSLLMTVKFTTCGGKLTLDVPINLGPCTDPVHLDKTNSVPLFNRPLRFPYFSLHSNGTANGDAHKVLQQSTSGPPVSSKFSYGACSNRFCCCLGDTTLL